MSSTVLVFALGCSAKGASVGSDTQVEPGKHDGRGVETSSERGCAVGSFVLWPGSPCSRPDVEPRGAPPDVTIREDGDAERKLLWFRDVRDSWDFARVSCRDGAVDVVVLYGRARALRCTDDSLDLLDPEMGVDWRDAMVESSGVTVPGTPPEGKLVEWPDMGALKQLYIVPGTSGQVIPVLRITRMSSPESRMDLPPEP